jgi:hypothetical protein
MGGMASFLFHPFLEKGLANVTDAVRKGGTILPAEGSVSEDNPVWVNFARGMAPLTVPSAGLIARLTAGSGPMQVQVAVGLHALSSSFPASSRTLNTSVVCTITRSVCRVFDTVQLISSYVVYGFATTCRPGILLRGISAFRKDHRIGD